jgi:hypothetical protein
MRISVFLGAASAAAIAVAAPLLAAETIAYSYDARGRLIQVSRTGTVNNGLNTGYSFDKADNRIQAWTGTGSPPAPPSPPPPPPPPPAPPSPPPPSFAIANATAVGEGGTLVFAVTKSGSATSSFSVNYATGTGGSATSGSDFTAGSGTLTFTASETSKVVSVATIDDNAVESAETVPVTLSSPSGGASLGTSAASGTINDNDVANSPPVTANDSISLQRCGVGYVDLGANDSDPNGDLPLEVISVVNVNNPIGTSVILWSDSTVEVTGGSSNGTSTHTYTIRDSRGATSTGTLTVTVLGGFC